MTLRPFPVVGTAARTCARVTLLAGLFCAAVSASQGDAPSGSGAPSHGVEPERAASGRLPADVSWAPERPLQGHLFVLRVRPSAGAGGARVRGTAAGEPLHFERVDDGTFVGLAAVPVDARGVLPVRLAIEWDDGTEEVVEPEISIAPAEFRHESLTVAPRFGSPPDSADRARLARERAKSREVSRVAHATRRLWTDRVLIPRNDRVTSGFGNGREFNGQITSRHMGLDLDGEPGDTVVAVARGVVALVDEFLLAGNIVYLNHGAGLVSGYFHLSEQLVSEGEVVEPGTPIGRVGATGRVTGPHLHWVVRYGGTSVDPRSLLSLADELGLLSSGSPD